MNTRNKVVTTALAVLAAGFITQARAQSVRQDIAASPKVRQMFKEWGCFGAQPQTTSTVSSVRFWSTVPGNIAASPKVGEMLNEREHTRLLLSAPLPLPLRVIAPSARMASPPHRSCASR